MFLFLFEIRTYRSLHNGFQSFLRSLPPRHDEKPNGEHLHKLGVQKLDDSTSSDFQEIVRLNKDNETKTLLERL